MNSKKKASQGLLIWACTAMLIAVGLFAIIPNPVHAAPPPPIDLCADGAKHFNKWYFGQQAAMDFSTLTPLGYPTPITTSMMTADEGVFSFADANGDLLFYSNGNNIWDRTNTIMPNGSSLGGDQSAAQAGIVVPDPADGDLYYIFTAYGNSPNLYSQLDMALNSGFGDIALKAQTLPGGNKGNSEKVTATRHSNGTDYWVATADKDNGDIFVYQITSAGIMTPTTYSLGGNANSNGGEMDFSADGSLLVVGAYFSSRIYLIDFDPATGALSNKRELAVPFLPYGVETSGDSKILYSSSTGTTVYQYDLTQPTESEILASVQYFTKSSDGLSIMEIGPDGRMYVAQATTYHTTVQHLDLIEYPSSLGSKAGYVQQAITFTVPVGAGSRSGLPNNFPCPVPIRQNISSNADLSNLAVAPGTLAPAFDSGTVTYTVSVVHSVEEITVGTVVSDVDATVAYTVTPPGGGAPITCTGDPADCPLAVGDNVIKVTVTAEDGVTIKSYYITVTRAGSSDADLAGLAIDPGTLSPAFAPETTVYTSAVSSDVADVDVIPTVSEPNATVSIVVTPPGGLPIACSGSPVNCPLAVGDNVIDVTVTAQDGTTIKTYQITVNRPPSSNADLSGLTIDPGTLSPSFAPATTAYGASVGNGIADVDVIPTVSEPNATVSIVVTPPGGLPIACSGSPVNCPLAVGDNVIDVTVTAQDGTTIKTYQITVTRAPDVDATLSNLVPSTGVLAPTFAPATTAYVANVAAGTTEFAVTPTTTSNGATMTVNGQPVASGSASPGLTLPQGRHLIVDVVVTSAGGVTQTYQVVVNRPPTVVNKAATTLQGTPVTIALSDREVSDADGDAWEVGSVANGANGTVTLNADGTFVYTPNADFTGVDSFVVIVMDGYGGETEVLVTVVVAAKAEGSKAGILLAHDNVLGSSHVVTNAGSDDSPFFTMSLDLPAGAYSGTLGSSDIFYLIYTEILTPTSEVTVPPSGLRFAGNIFTLEAFLNNINLEDYVFGKPFTITLSYDPIQLNGLNEESLVLYYWDEETQSWAQDGLTEVARDAEANTVTYTISHLTQFSWFADGGLGYWFPWVPQFLINK